MNDIIEIYGITDCPYCLMARSFCMARNLEYIWIDLDMSPAARKAIKEQYSWQTFPVILKSRQLIGGFTELKQILK